jgi:hypothetical protein
VAVERARPFLEARPREVINTPPLQVLRKE